MVKLSQMVFSLKGRTEMGYLSVCKLFEGPFKAYA